jgi:D-alanyl-D-alanine carboxypeptidase/D-alanyl-D-alanine-endopeptidase (penicillin-binding protein 4)
MARKVKIAVGAIGISAALAVTLAGCSSSAGSQPGTSASSIPGLSQQAVEVMNSPPYSHATWAVSVTDAASGEKLVDYNANAFLEPASVTKTYSVGGGWLQFGPDSRIVTPVVRTGTVANGQLTGDLILVAKGDITMGGQTGADGKVVFTNLDHNDANAIPGATLANNNPLAGLDQLAQQVKASGITAVSGRVEVDDRLFVTKDLGEDDGPVSPIVINNNLIDIVTTPGQPGQPSTFTMRPEVAPWTVDNKVTTVPAGGTTKIAVSSSRDGVITLTGTIAADSAPTLNVWHLTDPATFARTAFIEALQRAGVTVSAPPTQVNTVAGLGSEAEVNSLPKVASLEGLSYDQNATYILKISYNRGAQTQVCLLAVAAGSKDCDDGFPQLAKVLSKAGIDPLQASLVDGSGLPGNFITAASEGQLQRVFAARPDAAAWRAALPTMGVDGSIATVQVDSPAKGQVSAKTGTLGAADLLNNRLRLETKALGGYITAKSGRQLTVTIIMNQAMFSDIQGVFAANEDLGKIATSIWESY